MIKGVNKRIVEINNPQNEYFEKAILYIRPEKHALPPAAISLEAKEYLNRLKPREAPKRKLSPVFILILSGIAVTLLIILLLIL